MRVKICGITNTEDARMAGLFGADAIGFLIGLRHKSEDEIDISTAKEIIRVLPPYTTPVLVTHLVSYVEIARLIEKLKIHTVQLHDDISPEEIINLKKEYSNNIKVIKTIHITNDKKEIIEKVKTYMPIVDALELDSINLSDDRIGGTGVIHNWSISKIICKISNKPVILAGGLNPNNVGKAIRTVKPFGVDVNTGVKISRYSRKKDPKKMKLFILNAKKAFLELL